MSCEHEVLLAVESFVSCGCHQDNLPPQDKLVNFLKLRQDIKCCPRPHYEFCCPVMDESGVQKSKACGETLFVVMATVVSHSHSYLLG